jgi:hypothetical protein
MEMVMVSFGVLSQNYLEGLGKTTKDLKTFSDWAKIIAQTRTRAVSFRTSYSRNVLEGNVEICDYFSGRCQL